MVSKYVAKAKRLGLWSEEQERMWLAKGAKRRAQGKTEAPSPLIPATQEEDPFGIEEDQKEDF
jgi:hypothetical protein